MVIFLISFLHVDNIKIFNNLSIIVTVIGPLFEANIEIQTSIIIYNDH